MKNLFVLLSALFLLVLATPNAAHAQCPSNADQNPCYALPSGNCVCYPNGKLRPWLAVRVLAEARPTLPSGSNATLFDCVNAYYWDETLSITYLGGNWDEGQQFQVSDAGGGSTIIVIFDGL